MIRNALLALLCLAWLGALVVIASGPSGGPLKVLTHPATAGWAQAIGAFVAILGAVWISRRDQQHRMESKRTEDLERSRIVVIHARRLRLMYSDEDNNPLVRGEGSGVWIAMPDFLTNLWATAVKARRSQEDGS